MAGRVIQGFFLDRGPLAAIAVAAPRPNIVQPKALAGRPAPAHVGPAVRPGPLQPQGGQGGNFQVDPVRLGLARGAGTPLPQALLAKMEAAFSADFSAVRVHVGDQAARIGAIAFTTGNDLYFAPGQFQPNTQRGQELIGHELAHVIQQRQGRVRAPGQGVAVVQDRALEAEADRLGTRAASFAAPIQRAVATPGRPNAPALATVPFGAAVQRMKRARPNDKAYAANGTFRADDSDSETDVEDVTKRVKVPTAKNPKGYHEVTFNHTKRKAVNLKKGKRHTKRDKNTNKRLVPRVDNAVYHGNFPKLSADAKIIHDAIDEYNTDGTPNESYAATTIVCVVLINKRNLYRKYCFTNLNRTIGSDVAAEANRLGYHVVVALNSHAEAEMIQYMHTYKHVGIVAIGCDKAHCQECSFMMSKYFDGLSTDKTTSNEVFKKYHMNPILTDATGLTDRPFVDQKWKKKYGKRLGRGDYDPTEAQTLAIGTRNLVRIPPNGDCLYEALVQAGHAVSVQALRNALGAAIRTNTIDVSAWGNPATIATKIEKMGSYNNRVGDYAPELLCQHLGIRMQIINESGTTTPIGVGGPIVTLVRVRFPLAHYHLVT